MRGQGHGVKMVNIEEIDSKDLFDSNGKFKFKQFWGNGYCVYCGKSCNRTVKQGKSRIISIHKECESKYFKYIGENTIPMCLQ